MTIGTKLFPRQILAMLYLKLGSVSRIKSDSAAGDQANVPVQSQTSSLIMSRNLKYWCILETLGAR